MAVKPRLLNPTKVKIAQKKPAQQFDHLRRTPINTVALESAFVIDAQVKWNVQLGEFGNPAVLQEGVDEREMGYLMLRVKDLKAQNKEVKRGDRIVLIGNRPVTFYVARIDFGSHYVGDFTLIKVTFVDREGKDG